jgi:hypothetical protein
MVQFPTESGAISGGYYMQNLVSIGQFLMANGYSRAAAAGVAGTIAGESGGNPESVGSGGAGLIGWTPPSSAGPDKPIVTGNPSTDWEHQLTDLLAYADANSQEAINRGGVNLDSLKKATNPNQAATWWSMFEGPAVPGSDIRNSVVGNVYKALGGNPGDYTASSPQSGTSSSGGQQATDTGFTGNPLSWLTAPVKGAEWAGSHIYGATVGPVVNEASGLAGIVSGISGLTTAISQASSIFLELFQPQLWLRVGAFIVGVIALIMGFKFLKGSLESAPAT